MRRIWPLIELTPDFESEDAVVERLGSLVRRQVDDCGSVFEWSSPQRVEPREAMTVLFDELDAPFDPTEFFQLVSPVGELTRQLVFHDDMPNRDMAKSFAKEFVAELPKETIFFFNGDSDAPFDDVPEYQFQSNPLALAKAAVLVWVSETSIGLIEVTFDFVVEA